MLEDLAKFLLAQSFRSEVRDGGIIRHFSVHSQAEEIFIGEVKPGILDDLPVRVAVKILKQAESEHVFRVFGRSTKIRRISVLTRSVTKEKLVLYLIRDRPPG